MPDEMTPYDRVMARLNGRPVDRIPNLCILMTFAARYIGITYDRYVTDYRLLVEGNLRCCEDFGIDMLSAISDPMRETHGFGAEVVIPYDGVPYAVRPLITNLRDLDRLSVNDPAACDRMADRLGAIQLYRQKAGSQYPLLGWVEGAFAEACDLRGLSSVMTDMIDTPDFLVDLLEICCQQAIEFARAQIAAGADFIGIGDAAASLIGPRYYKKFALPYEQRIVAAIHDAGAKAKLHICGNISSILPAVLQSGADMIDIDWMVDFGRSISTFGAQSAGCGNFDPVKVLLQGNPDTVAVAVRACVGVASSTTFIAAGCEVPRDTPLENLKAVTQTLEHFARS